MEPAKIQYVFAIVDLPVPHVNINPAKTNVVLTVNARKTAVVNAIKALKAMIVPSHIALITVIQTVSALKENVNALSSFQELIVVRNLA